MAGLTIFMNLKKSLPVFWSSFPDSTFSRPQLTQIQHRILTLSSQFFLLYSHQACDFYANKIHEMLYFLPFKEPSLFTTAAISCQQEIKNSSWVQKAKFPLCSQTTLLLSGDMKDFLWLNTENVKWQTRRNKINTTVISIRI